MVEFDGRRGITIAEMAEMPVVFRNRKKYHDENVTGLTYEIFTTARRGTQKKYRAAEGLSDTGIILNNMPTIIAMGFLFYNRSFAMA